MLHDKKYGVATAVGITSGNAIHIIHCWYGVIALLFDRPKVGPAFMGMEKYIMRFMGGFFNIIRNQGDIG